MENSKTSSETLTEELTEEEKARIETNRQNAIAIRKRKLVAHPYAKSNKINIDKHILKVAGTKVIDTGGGFLIEEENDFDGDIPLEFLKDDAPFIGDDRPECEECKKQFSTSYLLQTFDHPVCDECRDNEDKHTLITKTDAKKEYLLQDCDLDKREPPLKFITRKNPHNVRWGNMKLYLQVQVEKRALEVWGSEDNLREEMEKREEKRAESKMKKYHKQLKELRMNVRSSLFDKTSSASHTHSFGPETYDEEEDVYRHVCLTCNYEESFEKM